MRTASVAACLLTTKTKFLWPLLLVLICTSEGLNNRPIIGVLTEPSLKKLESYGKEYLAASYVKWIEAGGGRVAPIRYTADHDTLTKQFNGLNGILFPGGGASLELDSKYEQTTAFMYKLAVAANEKGDYFPIYGTCLGFETLAVVTANDPSVLTGGFNADNIALALNFTSEAPTSQMFGFAPDGIYEIFATQKVTANFHHFGVAPETYLLNEKLKETYTVLSVNKGLDGHEFISSWEGTTLPLFGTQVPVFIDSPCIMHHAKPLSAIGALTSFAHRFNPQWHPEKAVFEWNPTDVGDSDHSADSIRANVYMAEMFIDHARKSNHKFDTPEEEAAALIYTHPVTYTGVVEPHFLQVYFFDTPPTPTSTPCPTPTPSPDPNVWYTIAIVWFVAGALGLFVGAWSWRRYLAKRDNNGLSYQPFPAAGHSEPAVKPTDV